MAGLFGATWGVAGFLALLGFAVIRLAGHAREALAAEEKRKLRIEPDRLAIKVKGLFKPVVKRSGLKVGDVIVSVDGNERAATGGQFHAYLRLNHYKRGSTLDLVVLRGGQRKNFTIRF